LPSSTSAALAKGIHATRALAGAVIGEEFGIETSIGHCCISVPSFL